MYVPAGHMQEEQPERLWSAGLCSLWLQESSLLGESCPKAFLLAFDAGGNGRALATQAIPEQVCCGLQWHAMPLWIFVC